MDLVKIDVIELQTFEARLDAVHDVIARRAARIGGFRRRAEHLGGHHDLVARHLEVLQREAGDLLGQTLGIDVGGIDKVDAGVDRATNETFGVGLLQIADLTPDAFAAAEGHRAKTKFGHKEARAA